ncbi:MAG TPA: ATP-binding protein [Chthoniobacterales bacterium]
MNDATDVAYVLDRRGSAEHASFVAACLAVAIPAAVLLGWAVHSEKLRAFIPGLPVTNPAAALCLIALAVSLILLLPANVSRKRRIAGRALAVAVMAAAVGKILSLSFGWDWPIDRWLFPESIDAARIPSRIPIRTAIDLFLSAGALLLLETRTRRGLRPAEILCALSAVIAFLALIGYSYGLIALYRTMTYEPMSLPGAIDFMVLAAAILLARTSAGAMRIIVSDTTAGLVSRLLLPLAFLLPIVIGTLRIGGENAGWFTSRVGVALFVTAFLIFFFFAVWWTVRALFRSDTDRKEAEARVRQLNAELEQRVADRTAQLHLLNDELQQANKAKDDFLAVLSHELRTPLTPALAAASYLAEHDDLPSDLREEARAIRAGVQLEARLIDDLLDLTRIARGKIDLRPQVVDVHDVIRNTLGMVHEAVREKQVDLVTRLEAPEHYARVDPVRMQQVFWNLLNNAVKFSQNGGRVTIKSSNKSGRFELEVSDTGVGIPPEMQHRIFDAFEQGDHSVRRQFGGLGLGLTIAKKLLDLQGGTIAVHSEGKDRGAVFEVTLGLAERGRAMVAKTTLPRREIEKNLDLLLVDDHAQTLGVLSRLLRKRGHRVVTADSVSNALRELEQGTFDALITDIGLPDGTGHDIMRAANEGQAMPGIAFSGFGTEEDIRRSRETGFEHYLIKPVDFRELETCLGRIATRLDGPATQRS